MGDHRLGVNSSKAPDQEQETHPGTHTVIRRFTSPSGKYRASRKLFGIGFDEIAIEFLQARLWELVLGLTNAIV